MSQDKAREQHKLRYERVIALEGWDLEIWKVHVDDLKEQDKNARVMTKSVFERIKANIRSDRRLQSLPLCVWGEKGSLEIVSGHHRVRGARMSGLELIYVLVDARNPTRSQVLSMQLAHNALEGKDDPGLLRQIYEEIEDLELRLATGIDPKDLDILEPDAKFEIDSVHLDFDSKTMEFLFLPTQFEKVMETLDLVGREFVGVCRRDQYDELVKRMQQVSENEDIRNISAIMDKMCEIIEDYYRAVANDEPLTLRVKPVEEESVVP